MKKNKADIEYWLIWIVCLLIIWLAASTADAQTIKVSDWGTMHYAKAAVTYTGLRMAGANEVWSLGGAFIGAALFELYFDGMGHDILFHTADPSGADPADVVRDMAGAGLACCIDLLLQWKHRTYVILNNDQKRVGVMVAL